MAKHRFQVGLQGRGGAPSWEQGWNALPVPVM